MKIKIEGKEYKLHPLRGFEIFASPAKKRLLFFVSEEPTRIEFVKKTSILINDIPDTAYIYSFEFDLGGDIQYKPYVAIVKHALNDHALILEKLPLEENAIIYAIPLRMCKWFVPCDVTLLLRAHD